VVQRKKVSDLVGKTFNRLTVTEYLGIGKYDKHYWRCECSCGGEIILPTYRITGADPTVSCGCRRKETMAANRFSSVKHDLLRLQPNLYSIHQSMHQRCKNPKSQRWKYYGAKGIKVCDLWDSVEVFVEWALSNGYEVGLSIDRLDSSKDYSPENCQWVTVSENSRRMNAARRNAEVVGE